MTVRRFVRAAAVAWAGLASLLLAFAPIYTEMDGATVTRTTGIDVHGPDSLVAFSIPVLLTLAPFVANARLARPLMIASALLLVTFCILGAMSLGLYYVPSAVAMVYLAIAPIPTKRPET